MRYGKKQHKEEVLWLVRFLESWCNRKELELQTFEQLKAMQAGGYSPQAAYLKTMALYHTKGIESGQKLELLEQTESYLQLNRDTTNAKAIGKFKNKELDNCIDDLLKKYENNGELTRKDIPTLTKGSTIYLIISIANELLKIKRDLIDISDLLRMGIELDEPECLNLMGMAFQNSNIDEAENHYLLAIEKGSTSAMYNLALLYHENKHEIELAEKYYLMALENGDIFAMNNLAVLYENEKNDIESAEKYYLIGVENEDSTAAYNLALLYEDKKHDIIAAEKYYLKAIEKGDSPAMNNLALLYMNSGKDPDLIEKYFRLSYNFGNIKSSINLLNFYSDNNRTEDMIKLSVELFSHPELLENSNNVFRIINRILVKKQYHFLLQQFQKPDSQLMKYARPMYYVLAWFMRDELPGEYEKTGAEIKETVDEIIQQIFEGQNKNEVVETE